MKKKVIAFAALFGATCVSSAYAGQTTAESVATWSATAKKDTTSKLVVTPLGSLSFQYADGVKGFNTEKGMFDVAVQGDTSATAFKLTSRLKANTLSQLDNSGSTLVVGVKYNGETLQKDSDTVLIDTSKGINGGNLSAISQGYKTAGRITAQDSFTFSVISGTTDGRTAVSSLRNLPDGVWTGDVSVEFDATWTS